MYKTNNGVGFAALYRPRWFIAGALALILIFYLISRDPYDMSETWNQTFSGSTPESTSTDAKTEEGEDVVDDLQPEPLAASPAPLNNRTFHFLIPGYMPSASICRTILTSAILNYPPPMMITRQKGDKTQTDLHRVEGIYNFLNNPHNVADDDLVLIVDSRDTWFQLPPNVLISRYQELLRKGNADLYSRYTAVEDADDDDAIEKPRFQQTVVLGASKNCALHTARPKFCSAVPNSPLGPQYFRYSPKPMFPDIGNLLGPASELREIYKSVIQRAERESLKDVDSQFIMTRVFGLQEYGRLKYSVSTARTTRWREWFFAKFGWGRDIESLSEGMNILPNQKYDMGIGLDYASSIFMTLEEASDDVAFLDYHEGAVREGISASVNRSLPDDVLHAPQPWKAFVHEVSTPLKSTTLPFNGSLDYLPGEGHWSELSLATNVKVSSIPAVLYVHDDIPPDDMGPFWQKMWYHRYLRALMRNRLRFTGGGPTAHTAAVGTDTWWNALGGSGGLWTDKGVFADYSEMCNGFEADIFGDGMGRFGHEDNDKPYFNKWGMLISGKQPPKKEDDNKR